MEQELKKVKYNNWYIDRLIYSDIEFTHESLKTNALDSFAKKVVRLFRIARADISGISAIEIEILTNYIDNNNNKVRQHY